MDRGGHSGGDFDGTTALTVVVRIRGHLGHLQEFAEFGEGAGLLEEEVEGVLVWCGGVLVTATLQGGRP